MANLIDTVTHQWDRGKVHAIFKPDTREDILKIKLNNVAFRDRLVWKENKTNKFSVKTAYQVALKTPPPANWRALPSQYGPKDVEEIMVSKYSSQGKELYVAGML